MVKMKAEMVGTLGNVNYAAITQEAMEGIVSEVASGIYERTATEIHNITYETFKGIELKQRGTIAEIISTVPWSIKLEFHGHPFLRPAAVYMKRKISRIVKMILGPTFKAKTALKRGAK